YVWRFIGFPPFPSVSCGLWFRCLLSRRGSSVPDWVHFFCSALSARADAGALTRTRPPTRRLGKLTQQPSPSRRRGSARHFARRRSVCRTLSTPALTVGRKPQA